MIDNKHSISNRSAEISPDEHFPITPAMYNADLPELPLAIYVGVGGELVLQDRNGVDATYQPKDDSYVIFRAARVVSFGGSGLVGVL